METGKICSFTSHLHGMQNILATAVGSMIIVSNGGEDDLYVRTFEIRE